MNMYLSWKKFAVILCHTIITQNFASATLDHSTRERAALVKVLTSFLKIPWIKLDSSWADESSTCRTDLKTVFESADVGEMWALQMLDASSKIPSGILTGNIGDLGMYDECVAVRPDENPANIQGQHCMVSLAIPSNLVDEASTILFVQKLSFVNPISTDVDLSLTTSVCLPSSCNAKDITGFVNASIQSTSQIADFGVKVARVICSSTDSRANFTLGSILVISFFAVVCILLLVCTACDITVRTQPNITSPALRTAAEFSLYTNAIHLLNTELTSGSMPAIDGIRFLSTCLIILWHRMFSSLIRPKVNLWDIYEFRQSWIGVLAITLPYVVDTFFVMSGFLTSYWFLKRLHSGEKINIFVHYFHRYLRLTPCLAVVILFSMFILPHLGSGPMWDTLYGFCDEYCGKNWWINLLYMQNFWNRYQMCLPHTWYLAVEMQLFWLSPIILYVLFSRPKIALLILAALGIASFITPAIIIIVNQYSAFWNLKKSLMTGYHEFFGFYIMTYNRALPYLIGILLGYNVVKTKQRPNKVQAAFNWTLTCVFLLLCVLGNCFIQPIASVYDAVWEAFSVSIGRLCWSIATAWILYACTQGYGGPVTRLLSLPVFIPLSRISYSIFLVHFVVQVGTSATGRMAEYFSPISFIYMISGDLVLSTVVAFVLTLCIERPVLILEEKFKTRLPSSIVSLYCDSKLLPRAKFEKIR